jgi:hypothetical protein
MRSARFMGGSHIGCYNQPMLVLEWTERGVFLSIEMRAYLCMWGVRGLLLALLGARFHVCSIGKSLI